MSIATLANIEKTFGKRVIFDKLSLNVERGERIGFIGPNGSGKTTLFKVLIGQCIVDTGTVAIAKGSKVGHLSQDPTFDESNTVIDEAELAFAQLHELSHRLREIEHEMAALTGEALDRILQKYQAVQHEFDLAGGYAWRHKLEATMQGVGLLPDTWEQAVSTLSGGQRSRLALAKLLISEPDLLLLDEPTNHLDLAAIEWLEKYLLAFSGAVVLISHDRYLLDRLATRIVWLTGCRLKSYPGNYSSFVTQRELHELTQARAFEEQQADIEKQKEYIRRFGANQRARQAAGRKKRLDRLLGSDEMIQAVAGQRNINLSLSADLRAGDQVLSVRELSKSYGPRTLWTGLKFDVKRGERIGILGPNGSGKTTLLEVLLAREDADGGNIKWGANLNIGYYDQRLDEFDPESTVIEEAWGDRDVKEQQVRNVLGTLLFRGDDVYKAVGLLSGGERARVRLAQLLLDKPNVLVLDEPTNHLDIPSREALEATLAAFDGTLLCVSHDRYFLDKIAGRLLILDPPGMIDFADTYSEWVAKQQADAEERQSDAQSKSRAKSAAAKVAAAAPAAVASRDAKKKDNPYLRPFGRLSLEELEQQITETEIAIAECQENFGSADSFKDPTGGRRLQEEYEQLAKKLEQLEAEYFAREQ
ncbi:MAG TPA: ABC-F family ATP-binding cassette domain-containing protein [Tepidisphaeraceae bacterium]|nr:ABC-F family ATP-binding cassette domain-containing protein [Tepidisphaeraceae bacterium]